LTHDVSSVSACKRLPGIRAGGVSMPFGVEVVHEFHFHLFNGCSPSRSASRTCQYSGSPCWVSITSRVSCVLLIRNLLLPVCFASLAAFCTFPRSPPCWASACVRKSALPVSRKSSPFPLCAAAGSLGAFFFRSGKVGVLAYPSPLISIALRATCSGFFHEFLFVGYSGKYFISHRPGRNVDVRQAHIRGVMTFPGQQRLVCGGGMLP